MNKAVIIGVGSLVGIAALLGSYNLGRLNEHKVSLAAQKKLGSEISALKIALAGTSAIVNGQITAKDAVSITVKSSKGKIIKVPIKNAKIGQANSKSADSLNQNDNVTLVGRYATTNSFTAKSITVQPAK